jgi:hypothetical protein
MWRHLYRYDKLEPISIVQPALSKQPEKQEVPTSRSKTMKRLSFTCLALSFLRASANIYDGDYLLTEMYDENKASLALPAGEEFRLHLTVASEGGLTDQESSYHFYIKIGNFMNTVMIVTDDTESQDSGTVRFGPILSTRMMPPPKLVPVEGAVNTILSEASVIALTDGVLKLDGNKGGLTFQTV